jgi:hypothetical protein
MSMSKRCLADLPLSCARLPGGKHSITYIFFARPIGETLLLAPTCASSDPEGNADVRLTLCNRAPNLRVPTMRTAIRFGCPGPEQVDPDPSATERRNTACERGRRSMQTSTCAWSLGPGLFHSLLRCSGRVDAMTERHP